MKKITIWILAVLLLLAPASAFASEQDEPREVSIIFSHDMHSHMDSEKVIKDGKETERGGMARTYTKIKEIRSEYPDSFLLDGGDFSMGTAYQTIFSTQASELRMMGMMGYDATTFGNHEFDYRAQGLADMLNTASASEDAVPSLLCANIDWEQSLADEENGEAAAALKSACDEYGVKDYQIINRGGVKVGLFGVMGIEAAEFAPLSGVYFSDPVAAAQEVVKQLQAEGAEVIICLSHSGTVEDASEGKNSIEESEDGILATEVPDIDLIISGHTHSKLDEAVVIGDTILASCQNYNYYLGHVTLVEEDGEFSLKDYTLYPMDDSVKEDSTILEELQEFRELAGKEYFNEYGYDLDQVLATNTIDFTAIEEFGVNQGEDTLGNLLADSYIYAVAQAEGADSDPVDVAVVPSGVVRGSFFKGDITVADAFNSSSLGYGADGTPGYPLVSAYLTGEELKTLAEVDASVSLLMPVARLYCSGLSYDINPNRLILNRATDVQIVSSDGNAEQLEDDKLYRVTADLYSCQMLGSVKEQSFGLLQIEPKDAEGNLITDYEEHIIYNGSQELKAWYAVASYIDSFENDQVPEKYSRTEDRIEIVESWNPVELFKQPNRIAVIVTILVVVLVIIVIQSVRLVRRIRRRKKVGFTDSVKK